MKKCLAVYLLTFLAIAAVAKDKQLTQVKLVDIRMSQETQPDWGTANARNGWKPTASETIDYPIFVIEQGSDRFEGQCYFGTVFGKFNGSDYTVGKTVDVDFNGKKSWFTVYKADGKKGAKCKVMKHSAVPEQHIGN